MLATILNVALTTLSTTYAALASMSTAALRPTAVA